MVQDYCTYKFWGQTKALHKKQTYIEVVVTENIEILSALPNHFLSICILRFAENK